MEQEASFKIKQCRSLMVSPNVEKEALLCNPMVMIQGREGKLEHLCMHAVLGAGNTVCFL